MRKINKKQIQKTGRILVLAGFIFSGIAFSQNSREGNHTIPDNVIVNRINDFLEALNSGERDRMQQFIINHYDPHVLKRAPIYVVIDLNMALYYETGGIGYDLHKLLPTEGNLITAELYNKFTDSYIKIKIPVSKNAGYKINWLIQSETVHQKNLQNQKQNPDIAEFKKRLDILFKILDENEVFSGTVLVAKYGNILYEKALGMSNKSFNIPNNPETKFNIASLGKMFTGTAITQLVEKGKVSFDDPISKFVSSEWLNPEISKRIQIKHLLTHTSGLGDYFQDAYQQSAVPFFRDLEDYKSLIVDDTLSFEPGSRFSYSNTGMLLLGVIIENATGEEYFDYLRKNIFGPAEMINTDGFSKDRPVENRATGYTKIYEDNKMTWDNHQYTRIMRGSPSGGVYSTVHDMLKFDIALRSNKLLSPEYSKIIFEGRPELNASFHSYGFFVSESHSSRVVSHQGDGRGVHCYFEMFLDSGLTVIVLSNYSPPSAKIVSNVIGQLIPFLPN